MSRHEHFHRCWITMLTRAGAERLVGALVAAGCEVKGLADDGTLSQESADNLAVVGAVGIRSSHETPDALRAFVQKTLESIEVSYYSVVVINEKLGSSWNLGDMTRKRIAGDEPLYAGPYRTQPKETP